MRIIIVIIVILLASISHGSEQPAGSAASSDDSLPNLTTVYYVTNRQQASKGGKVIYGGARGEPAVGRCEVEFEKIPVMEQIASHLSFYVPRESSEMRVEEISGMEDFLDLLADRVKQTASGGLVVFVHGYNYDFERNCGMAAELQRTLRGDATLLMFSWPSNGKPTDYVSDLADVEWSVPFLAQTIRDVSRRLGPENIVLMTHSIGSRGGLFALQELARQQGGQQPLIHKLVLLAPDFDAQTFLDRLPALRPLAGAITLYASGNDTPLKVSRQLSGYPRLGEAGEYLTVTEGIETVDVSPGGRYEILGHEYFRFHPRASADLAELLVNGTPADERTGLRPRVRDGITYWELSE